MNINTNYLAGQFSKTLCIAVQFCMWVIHDKGKIIFYNKIHVESVFIEIPKSHHIHNAIFFFFFASYLIHILM